MFRQPPLFPFRKFLINCLTILCDLHFELVIIILKDMRLRLVVYFSLLSEGVFSNNNYMTMDRFAFLFKSNLPISYSYTLVFFQFQVHPKVVLISFEAFLSKYVIKGRGGLDGGAKGALPHLPPYIFAPSCPPKPFPRGGEGGKQILGG